MEAKLFITVERDVVFDEFCECAKEICELRDMIPEYRCHEADMLTERIKSRMTNWIKIKTIKSI